MKTILMFAMLASVNTYAVTKSDGRFQIVKMNTSKFDAMMLDTQTGRIWSFACVSQNAKKACNYFAWVEDDVVGISMDQKTYFGILKEKHSAPE